MKHYRIVNYKRFITSVTVLLIATISLFNIALAKQEDNYIISEYTVEAGNTLWQIASENKAKNEDIRQYIEDIKQLNQMTSTDIYKGQTLLIKERRWYWWTNRHL